MRGAGGRFGRSAFVNNDIFHENGLLGSVVFGEAGGLPGEDIQFSGNTVQGALSFNELRRYVVTGNRVTSGAAVLRESAVLVGYRPLNTNASVAQMRSDLRVNNQWDGNLYATPAGNTQDPFYVSYARDAWTLRFENWRDGTGFDATSRYVTGQLPADAKRDVVVRPNRYEAGRAFITVWNHTNLGSAQADVSGVLRTGDRYVVHHVYDVFGAPVVTGTYQGGTITLPLTRRTAPAPIGLSAPAPSSNEFSVFLLRKL